VADLRDGQAAKHGPLLQLMSLHAMQDAIEEANGVDYVLTFIQHDALGADAHGRIGDFSARGRPR
jgi:hypothetical protein